MRQGDHRKKDKIVLDLDPKVDLILLEFISNKNIQKWKISDQEPNFLKLSLTDHRISQLNLFSQEKAWLIRRIYLADFDF